MLITRKKLKKIIKEASQEFYEKFKKFEDIAAQEELDEENNTVFLYTYHPEKFDRSDGYIYGKVSGKWYAKKEENIDSPNWIPLDNYPDAIENLEYGLKTSQTREIYSEETSNLDYSSEEYNPELEVIDPVSVSGSRYPERNVRYVESAMDEMGVTNKYLRLGILCTIAKESNFIPQSESMNYSKERLPEIWGRFSKTGSRVPEGQGSMYYNDLAVEYEVKGKSGSERRAAEKRLADFVYGGRYGNGPDEGYKYRGRGFNQVTFKDAYRKMSSVAGADLVSNPDRLNDPEVCAKVTVKFIIDRVETSYGSTNPSFTSYDQGIKAAAEANCKSPTSRKDCSRAISHAKARLSHFKYR